ncbi:MAG: hypothetical protein KatS3mg009_2852 [Acidimicrobiia bacterium]|nr:MAG: hypothetical protein KatS3mg009_2852 [Acidimicrobiia bacterium]
MRAVRVGAGRRQEWDDLVAAAPSFSLLQSWAWGEFKEATGWRAVRVGVEDGGRLVAGAQVLVRPAPLRAASVAYVPRGPFGDWARPDVATVLFPTLDDAAREHRALFLRVEPAVVHGSPALGALRAAGFCEIPAATNQPRATIVVDIAPEPDAILAAMHQKTRYNIRYGERRGVEVRVGSPDDADTVHALLHETARRAGFRARSRRYYREQLECLTRAGHVHVLVASHDGRPIAVNVSAAFGPHAAYLHGASLDVHPELKANAVLMWRAMQWARARGCTSFDLWGIPDEVGIAATEGRELLPDGSTHGLWGVYRFKRGFGGSTVCFAAAHDRPYVAPLYRVVTRVLDRSGERG